MGNIALNKPADASNFMNPYIPAKAVDGVVTPMGRWVGSSPLPPEPSTPAPVWLRVDLGATFWVNRWVVKQMGTLGWSTNYNLVDYKFQGSLDYNNWFDLDSVTNNSLNVTDRLFTGKKARWIRVYITKGLRCNTNFASIADFEAYEAANAPYLSGLTIKSGAADVPLSPLFGSKTYSYTATVDSTASSVDVTPITAVGSIKVNNTTVNSGSPVNVPLTGGSNTITVTVTSPDSTMTETYTVVVTKQTKSAYLSGLVVNGIRGAINPSFASRTMSYTASVAGGVTSVTVTPTAEDSQATIQVNTFTVPSTQTSPPINLSVGTNTITILVTASDNSSHQTYTVVVTRPS